MSISGPCQNKAEDCDNRIAELESEVDELKTLKNAAEKERDALRHAADRMADALNSYYRQNMRHMLTIELELAIAAYYVLTQPKE